MRALTLHRPLERASAAVYRAWSEEVEIILPFFLFSPSPHCLMPVDKMGWNGASRKGFCAESNELRWQAVKELLIVHYDPEHLQLTINITRGDFS
jgi:hypothetical protein